MTRPERWFTGLRPVVWVSRHGTDLALAWFVACAIATVIAVALSGTADFGEQP